MKTKLEEAAEALKDSIENFDDWTTGEVRDLALASLEGGYNVAKLESNQAIQELENTIIIIAEDVVQAELKIDELVQFITEFRDKNFSKDGNLTGHHWQTFTDVIQKHKPKQ